MAIDLTPPAFRPIHVHFMIKAYVMETFVDRDIGKEMLKEIVRRIGMKPVTEPQCVYVADDGNEGLTGSINLATSHVAFHVWDEPKMLQLDVYSCKQFEHRRVVEVIKEYYVGLTYFELMIVDREDFRIIYRSRYITD